MEVTIIPASISVVNKEVEREQQYYYCPGGQRTIHRQGDSFTINLGPRFIFPTKETPGQQKAQ